MQKPLWERIILPSSTPHSHVSFLWFTSSWLTLFSNSHLVYSLSTGATTPLSWAAESHIAKGLNTLELELVLIFHVNHRMHACSQSPLWHQDKSPDISRTALYKQAQELTGSKVFTSNKKSAKAERLFCWLLSFRCKSTKQNFLFF